MFNYILLIDFVDIENRFRGISLLNLQVNIVLMISSLPKLSVGYDVCVETGDIGDIL